MKKIRRKSEREVLTWHGEKEVPYFTFPSFEKLPEIVHGFSSRLGGVSEGCLSSMNLSFSRGDEPERVRENFRRMAESIGFSEENLVFSCRPTRPTSAGWERKTAAEGSFGRWVTEMWTVL